MPPLDPIRQREFALAAVKRLREAGFEAYWAGGCVRDKLLCRPPKDFDVATSALPDQIRDLFGRRRTIAVGAAFGVIGVIGPPGAGQVEVTTFRRDAGYSDGRHPDSVTFSSAQEDASRRDFTINGLFYDPIGQQVIDFVGGQADLEKGLIRAIGNPAERFAEDKLRMLRAVRFAATFGFELEAQTQAAIRTAAAQIAIVSPERIAAEMRRLLVEPHRVLGVRLLVETGLAAGVLPEIVTAGDASAHMLEKNVAVLRELSSPDFSLALAALLGGLVDSDGAAAVGQRWRLSNAESRRTVWLVEHRDALRSAASQPRSRVFRILAEPEAADLVQLTAAMGRAGLADPADAQWCGQLLQGPRVQFAPQPLISGDDLLRQGVPAGPIVRSLLDRVRDAQLEGQVCTKDQALALVERLRTGP